MGGRVDPDDARRWRQGRRRRLMAEGQCVACARPHSRSGQLCARCARKNSAYTRARYARLKATALCTVCGKLPAVEGQSRCRDCADNNVEVAKRIREERIAAGRCIDCSRMRTADETTLRCRLCSIRCSRRRADSKLAPGDSDELSPSEWKLLEALGGDPARFRRGAK